MKVDIQEGSEDSKHTCLFCQEEIINKKKNLFCSKECCDNSKKRIIKLICPECSASFERRSRKICGTPFCCVSCSAKYRNKQRKLKNLTQVPCDHCGKLLIRTPWYLKTHKHHFCNYTCSAIYRNAHKTKGYRRSKLEVWLEQKLIETFPTLDFKFNEKLAIKSELDIYIPSLSLAFELNGIFHYEPIYGDKTLNQVQNNDKRKFQACGEAKISLCLIDISRQKYFKESSSQEFLDIVVKIINENLLRAVHRL